MAFPNSSCKPIIRLFQFVVQPHHAARAAMRQSLDCRAAPIQLPRYQSNSGYLSASRLKGDLDNLPLADGKLPNSSITSDRTSRIARCKEDAVLSTACSACDEAFSTAFSADSIIDEVVLCSCPDALRKAAFEEELKERVSLVSSAPSALWISVANIRMSASAFSPNPGR